MGIALSTAGVIVSYAVETEAGTRPTTGYKVINDITSTPEFNVEPNGIDVTPLSETESKHYVQGLKDYGSALAFGALLTNELITTWNKVCSDAATGKRSDFATWFQIDHPDLEKSIFISADPSELGLPAMEVDSALTTSLYVTPNGAAIFDKKVEIAQ